MKLGYCLCLITSLCFRKKYIYCIFLHFFLSVYINLLNLSIFSKKFKPCKPGFLLQFDTEIAFANSHHLKYISWSFYFLINKATCPVCLAIKYIWRVILKASSGLYSLMSTLMICFNHSFPLNFFSKRKRMKTD